jgi:hypothetical protein
MDHSTVPFHLIVHQEALCTKCGLSYMKLTAKIATEVVNFVVSRFKQITNYELITLKWIDSKHDGLLMYNSVRWLRRGHMAAISLEYHKKRQYSTAATKVWLSTLIFFSDSRFQLIALNEKLQGLGEPTNATLIINTASGNNFKLYSWGTRDVTFQNVSYATFYLFIYYFICAGFSPRSLILSDFM